MKRFLALVLCLLAGPAMAATPARTPTCFFQQQQKPQTDPAMLALLNQIVSQNGQILQQQGQILAILLARQSSPSAPQQSGPQLYMIPIPGGSAPQQILPIAGGPQQTFPQSPPQQSLPITGAPQQTFPQSPPQQQIQIFGSPQQQLPLSPGGQPQQQLPVAPQSPGPQQKLSPQTPAAPPATFPAGPPVGYQRYTIQRTPLVPMR